MKRTINLTKNSYNTKHQQNFLHENPTHSVFFYVFKALILKYCSVKGRASRKEFWSLHLFLAVAELLVVNLYEPLFMTPLTTQQNPVLYYIIPLMSLILLPPKLGICVRRVHDFGRSGWWLLIPTLKIIMFPFIAGDDKENKFGIPE